LRPRLGELISSNQLAFIKGRSLHENFVLVRQVARKINQRRSRGVLLKFDISRAFDTISWSFLFEVLERLGFSQLFRSWLAILLRSASSKVVVSRTPGASIQQRRGVHQGDPASPILFVAGMEVLTTVISIAVQDQIFLRLAGISLLQRISLYADDIVVFIKPEEHEPRAIREIVQIFGEASRLQINYKKTTMTLIRGDEEDETRVRSTLAVQLQSFQSNT
jgi:hypothetical protein